MVSSDTKKITGSINFVARLMRAVGWLPDENSPEVKLGRRERAKYPFYYKILFWVNLLTFVSFITSVMIFVAVSLFDPGIIKQPLFGDKRSVILINSEWAYVFAFVAIIGSIPISILLYYPIHLLLYPKRIRDYFDLRSYIVKIARSQGGTELEIAERAKKIEPKVFSGVDIDKVNKRMLPAIKFLAGIGIIGVISYGFSLLDYMKINHESIGVRSVFTLEEKRYFYNNFSEIELRYKIIGYRKKTKDGFTRGFYPELVFHSDQGKKEILLWDFNRTLVQTDKLVEVLIWMKQRGVTTSAQATNFIPQSDTQYLKLLPIYQILYEQIK